MCAVPGPKFVSSREILPTVHVYNAEIFVWISSFHTVPAGSKLTVHLACLRCAKTECRNFDAAASDSFTDLFATAMHLADEQVTLCVCVCVYVLCVCVYVCTQKMYIQLFLYLTT